MKIYISFLITLFILSCAAHTPVVLTPEGLKVNIIGVDLAQSLPGKPLDKCSITGHSNIEYKEMTSFAAAALSGNLVCKTERDLKNELLNDVGKKGGNVAMLTLMQRSRDGSCYINARAVALSCSDETLKAAGFGK